LSALSCSTEVGPSCRDVFEYSFAADVESAPRVPCEVRLSAAGKTARYAVPKLPDPDLQRCFEQNAQPECTPLDASPPADSCAASVCSVAVTFWDARAHALAMWLGSETYTMTVLCDTWASAPASIQPLRQICAL
jgi:hypothetical protein